MWGRAGNRRAGKHTHTDIHTVLGTPPVPSPWRRGHWHHFLSLVSLAEDRSLFSGHVLQSGAARKPPLCNQWPHLNRRHVTAASTHSHTKQLSMIHQQLTGHDADSGDLLVRPHLLAFYWRPWGLWAERLAGTLVHLGWKQQTKEPQTTINTQLVSICNIKRYQNRDDATAQKHWSPSSGFSVNSSCTLRARQTLQNFRQETDPTQKQTPARQPIASLADYMTEMEKHKQRLSLSKWPPAPRGGAAVLHPTHAQSPSCLYRSSFSWQCVVRAPLQYTAAEVQDTTIPTWCHFTL